MLLIGALILLLVGLYGLAVKRDVVKLFIGIIIIEFAAELLLVTLGEKNGVTGLLGLAVMVLLLALILRLQSKFGTADLTKYEELKG